MSEDPRAIIQSSIEDELQNHRQNYHEVQAWKSGNVKESVQLLISRRSSRLAVELLSVSVAWIVLIPLTIGHHSHRDEGIIALMQPVVLIVWLSIQATRYLLRVQNSISRLRLLLSLWERFSLSTRSENR